MFKLYLYLIKSFYILFYYDLILNVQSNYKMYDDMHHHFYILHFINHINTFLENDQNWYTIHYNLQTNIKFVFTTNIINIIKINIHF